MFGMEGEKEGVLESWSSPLWTFVKLSTMVVAKGSPGHAPGELIWDKNGNWIKCFSFST